MSHRLSHRVVSLVVAASFWASVAPAQQEVDPAAVAAARAAGIEGVRLAEAGNCPAAIESFQRAEKLYHAPTTLHRLAECEITVGHLVLGTELLRRLVREELSENAPQAFLDAREQGERLLEATLPRLARLRISVASPPGPKAEVTVDGNLIKPAMFGLDRPFDPGTHTIEAKSHGFKPLKLKVALEEREQKSVNIKLEVDPNAPPEPPPAVVARERRVFLGATPESAPASPWRKPTGFAMLGVGGAGLVTGAIFGLFAMRTNSTLDDACRNNSCPPDQRDNFNSLKTQGTIATAGIIGGGVLTVIGTVLLLTGPSRAPSEAAASNFTGEYRGTRY